LLQDSEHTTRLEDQGGFSVELTSSRRKGERVRYPLSVQTFRVTCEVTPEKVSGRGENPRGDPTFLVNHQKTDHRRGGGKGFGLVPCSSCAIEFSGGGNVAKGQ